MPRAKLRYAVLGLGHIAQSAVLPAFSHAKKNSELVALVSGDKEKLRVLGKKFGVAKLWSYKEYGERMADGAIDAVYVAVPNDQHRHRVVEAVRSGLHVLCEKPLAVTEADCRAMIGEAHANRVQLMTAYRLHLDPATLSIMDRLQRGKIGEVKYLQAALSLNVRDPHNIRRNPRKLGGGPLFDLGIYCINAARTFFRAEPEQVSAQMSAAGGRKGMPVEETFTGLLKFSKGRLATFVCSTAAKGFSELTLSGEKGMVRLEDAFDYDVPRRIKWTGSGGKLWVQEVPEHDQFAAELVYFSDCVLHHREPQPSGWEGLADMRVIQALYRAAQGGRSQHLGPFRLPRRPREEQGIVRPPVAKIREFHAKAPGSS